MTIWPYGWIASAASLTIGPTPPAACANPLANAPTHALGDGSAPALPGDTANAASAHAITLVHLRIFELTSLQLRGTVQGRSSSASRSVAAGDDLV